MQRFKLSQPQAMRLQRLLHLEYTVRELSAEIACTPRTIRTALAAGCPHRKTPAGRVYVTGDEFRDWYVELCAGRRCPLGPGEAFCLRCRQAMPLPEDPEMRLLEHGIRLLSGPCPQCDTWMNRFEKAGVR